VLLRFISWTASHDFGQKGISNVLKKELVSLFLKSNYKVFVSAESTEDKFFEPYLLRIHPAKIHSVIAGASMLVGESGTMSTEACVLGTPAVFVNSLDAGVFKEEAKRELLYSYRNAENLLGKISLLLADRELETKHRARAAQLQAEFINVTDLLVWFVSDFPQSKKLMTAQPEIQNRFLDDTSAIRI
jgi:predicted glycosyltransferase